MRGKIVFTIPCDPLSRFSPGALDGMVGRTVPLKNEESGDIGYVVVDSYELAEEGKVAHVTCHRSEQEENQ